MISKEDNQHLPKGVDLRLSNTREGLWPKQIKRFSKFCQLSFDGLIGSTKPEDWG